MSRPSIRIYDSAFASQHSMHANSGNVGRRPTYFSWRRSGEPDGVAVFTDSHIGLAASVKAAFKVALIIEPVDLRTDPYDAAVEHEDAFDLILTYDRSALVGKGPKWQPYCFGGSRVAWEEWGLPPKYGMTSLVASPKRTLEGHKLRHAVIESFRGQLDAYGEEYAPFPTGIKPSALAPYRYTVAIENCCRRGWFTETLIDPMSLGTVPIYWGDSELPDDFDRDGIITFDTLDDLGSILTDVVSANDYDSRRDAIERNRWAAEQYRSTEDWLWRRYFRRIMEAYSHG